ncbi:molybdenum cofactor guanylyltransferase MobA [Microvirga splendida]|uniref:Molybdenum cofactor guanylyltransferase n=1 Tax=Microvirga splendida TaxID=2795727 RepID=A0ABS0XY96_9HYPH|nr:molybdenum cofactor guanylyltransferase MobA [Microvirga splendida]MBJ6124683.1 molybdenum cofactor guanylyltransferase MobA [Microvirga splendida]
MSPSPPTLGVILAGGLSRRMGGNDKALLTLGERTLAEHVAERLAPQCASVIVNANREFSRFEEMYLPVAPDSIDGHPGPLAGILAGLDWCAAHRPDLGWAVSVPADTPFIPTDLVRRLHQACGESGKPTACAASASQAHFAIGLWPVSLRHDLRQALVHDGVRSIREWLGRHGYAETSWPAEPWDPFFNINTPEDLDRARALTRQESLE